MARKVNHKGVAEAGLFGAYQRLVDLEHRTDLLPIEAVHHRAEARAAIDALENEVRVAGGDPIAVLRRVQGRELEFRSRMAEAEQA